MYGGKLSSLYKTETKTFIADEKMLAVNVDVESEFAVGTTYKPVSYTHLKYYGLPLFETSINLNYDIDMFNERGLYLSLIHICLRY